MTAVPNWHESRRSSHAGSEPSGGGERLRIVHINLELDIDALDVLSRRSRIGASRERRIQALLARFMGTSVEQIDRTYGHLLPDSLDRTRTALDAFIATAAEAEAR